MDYETESFNSSANKYKGMRKTLRKMTDQHLKNALERNKKTTEEWNLILRLAKSSQEMHLKPEAIHVRVEKKAREQLHNLEIRRKKLVDEQARRVVK